MSDNSTSNLWLFLELIARRRGLILTLVLLATLVAVVISLLLPKWYTANALLLPPSDEVVRSGLARLTEIELYTGGVRAPGLVTPNDVYARMIRSRRISDKIIERFNLAEKYDVTNASGLYTTLDDRRKVQVTDEGLLNLTFEDRDPQFAADVATAFVEELIDLNREIVSGSAREKKKFVEARMNEVRVRLDSARNALEAFQLQNRAVNLDEQARLVLNQAVDLKVKQASLELEIDLSEQTHGSDHPDVVAKREHLDLVDEQLSRLEWGDQKDSSFFSVPLSAVPGLRGRYESLYARVRVNESLYESLLELYEEARIQEQEDSPTIAVLDWPTVPDLRSRPKRSLIVLATFFCALMVSIFLAAWLEFVRRMSENQPDDYNRLMLFTGAFFGWLPGVRRSRGKR